MPKDLYQGPLGSLATISPFVGKFKSPPNLLLRGGELPSTILTALPGASLTSSWHILNSAPRSHGVGWRKGAGSQKGAWGHPALTRVEMGGERDTSPPAAAQSSGAHTPGKHHLFSWTRDLTGHLPRAPSGAAAAPPPAEPTSPVPASHADMQEEEEEEERFSRREEAYTQLFEPSLHCLMEMGALPSKQRLLRRDPPRRSWGDGARF